ncbi:hypothetical protein [Thermomonospora umbrina]|uniref:Uncharacterized protein n=1 Tax=Thermomonospora umbrina TaxID=111806 RepID=A0A3D9STZ3_9ACTN|nr:hypothetical protein [Thermomonospora umbrina]REE96455.1 hypothetical protein DFJ69_1892 [Thermomonospora umbrina]
MSTLQHRYRRLLRWYPADHRRHHGEEMLGVLLASASPDQERPTARDRADLLSGALKIRVRRGLHAAGRGWSDALAVAGLLAALFLAAQQIVGLTWYLSFSDVGVSISRFLGSDVEVVGDGEGSGLLGVFPTDAASLIGYLLTVIALAVAVCAVRGARRPAALLAWLYAAGTLAVALAPPTVGEPTAPLLEIVVSSLLLPVLLAGLTFGPGPRRGRELLGTRRTIVVGVTLTAALFIDSQVLDLFAAVPAGVVVAPAAFAVLAGLAMARPLGRRAALLMALPTSLGVELLQPLVETADGGYTTSLAGPPTTVGFIMGGEYFAAVSTVLAFLVAILWAVARRRRATAR